MIKNITKIYINRIVTMHNNRTIIINLINGYLNCIVMGIRWKEDKNIPYSANINILCNAEERYELVEFIKRKSNSLINYTYYNTNYNISE
jgi:hypothetical protein